MPGFRDRLNRLNEARKPASPPPKSGSPPVVGNEMVKASCGHPVPFQLFEDRRDKFREQRRAKATGRPCPECRRKEHEERTRQQQAEAAEKRKTRPPKHSKRDKTDRLPHGSLFTNLVYDAGAVLWRGELIVPVDGEDRLFSGEKSGIFRLLEDLDKQYRQWRVWYDNKKAEETSTP